MEGENPEVLSPAIEVTEVCSFFGANPSVYFVDGERNLADLIDASAVPNGSACVFVNGELQDLAICHMMLCEPGDRVLIRTVPRGRGDAKIIQTVVTLFAVVTSAIPGVGQLAQIGAAITAAAVNIGISLAFPPPSAPVAGDPGSIQNAVQISGSRNRMNIYGAVPVLFGDEVRVFPQYAAKPYTETIGGEQFIRMLFEIHHGRILDIPDSDMFIGQTPITAYNDIQTEVRLGHDDDEPSELFSLEVDETAENKLLTDPAHGIGPWQEFQTTPDAREMSMDLTAPAGLGAFDSSGALIGYTIALKFEYRTVFESPPSAWQDMDVEIAGVPEEIGWVLDPITLHIATLTQAHRGMLQRGVRFTFPTVWPAGWRVRVRIISEAANVGAVGTVNNWLTEMRVTRFRSITPSVAFGDDLTNVATVALRIRASDQINGAIDTFNCIAKPMVAEWTVLNGWSDKYVSPYWVNTPYAAWHYANILRGHAAKSPVDDDLIDHDTLNDWRVEAAGRGWTVAGQIGNQEQKRYWLEQMAGTSRAVPSRIDGKYAVIFERERATPVQLFTDRNSSGTSGRLTYNEQPHALRVRFIDKTSGSQAAELTVPADGYFFGDDDRGPVEATFFQDVDIWGVSDPDVAYIHGRYHLASARLRRRSISRNVDFENLIANRGDLVLVQDRASLLGADSLRIATVPTTPQAGWRRFQLDSWPQIEFPGVQNYLMVIRKPDGLIEITPSDIVWEGGSGDPANRWVSVEVTGFTGAEIAKGDLVSIVETDVGASEMLVTGIAYRNDLTATVFMTDYAPDILEADTGTIPPWDPGITGPVHHEVEAPQPPIISLNEEGIRSDEGVMAFDESGAPVPRILVSFTLPDSGPVADLIVGQFRLIDTDNPAIRHAWRNTTSVDPHNGQISFFPIEDGATYDVRIRAQANGKPSVWQLIEGHLAIGRTTPPPTPEDLDITPANVITWTMPTEPADLAGYVIRYKQGQAQHWETGLAAHAGIQTTTQVALADLPILPRGQEITIMVSAIDQIGITSGDIVDGAHVPDFVWIVTTLHDGILPNVISTNNRDPAFAGALGNCTVSGGDLIADTDTLGFWTGDDGSPFWNSDVALFWADKWLEMTYLSVFVTAGSGVMRFDIDADGDWSLEYLYDGGPQLPWPGTLDVVAGKVFFSLLTIPAGPVQGVVRTMSFSIDVDDRDEDHLANVSANPGAPGVQGDRVAPTVAFNTIQRCEVTITGPIVGAPPANAVGFIIHDLNPVTGPLVEFLDATGVTAPNGTTYDLRYVGF